jgi:nitroimidazol reductase NimA-like FMN-containing flavoprotein (pyridoxamine 5'-phosphate oxidase superfamily)
MPKLTADEIEDILTRPIGYVRLATIRPDGGPSIVPLAFAYRDRTIYLTARSKVKWLADIRDNPKVCLSIDDIDYERKKITVRGEARVQHEPGEDDLWRDLRLPLRSESWTGPTQNDDGGEEWDWNEAYTEMTWNEPRALVAIPLDEASVTSWRMPRVGELLDEAWASGYYTDKPRRFRVAQLGRSRADWRVIAEDAGS